MMKSIISTTPKTIVGKILCLLKSCPESETEPYDLGNPSRHNDIIVFAYSAVFARRCLNCSSISFVCKVCGKHYSMDMVISYSDLIIQHMMIHSGKMSDVKHGYIYVDFTKQSNGEIEYDTT